MCEIHHFSEFLPAFVILGVCEGLLACLFVVTIGFFFGGGEMTRPGDL